MSSDHWVRLVVDELPTGSPVWLVAQRATAEHYGWLESFPEWGPSLRFSGLSLRAQYVDLLDARRFNGGKPLRIGRLSSRSGRPARLVNRFRVARGWRLKDSARLAWGTTADWSWMEGSNGCRRTRDEWLAMPF